MTKVAFLGLGLMGQGMVENLLNARHDVTVWNRSPDKMAPLVAIGAKPSTTPAEAVEHADFIITILGDDAASRQVWQGDGGILTSAHLKPGAIAVESTTVSRQWMETLGVHCRDADLRFLDCPVTGGPPGARSGQLSLLVGGEAETLAAAQPILNAYAKRIYHFGPVGAGTAYKLIVNTVGAAHIAALAEAMCVAEKAGLDLTTVADALANGSVASRVTNYNAPKMATGMHDDVAFAVKWRTKDARYGSQMAQDLGCATPLFDHVADLFQRTLDAGFGEDNESAVLTLMKDG